MRLVTAVLVVSTLTTCLMAPPLPAAETPETAETWRARIEQDWFLQEEIRIKQTAAPLTTGADAAGGCDGVIDGKWGFHTGHSANPWWQVDLGAERSVSRVVVWNRCDGGQAERAARLGLFFSSDGQDWRPVYRHDGSVFRGFTDQAPLVANLEPTATRFVRVQLPGTTYLHLDEVQVFGPEDPDQNLALHRPADQISLSEWSTVPSGGDGPLAFLDWAARVGEIVANCDRMIARWRFKGRDMDDDGRDLDALQATLEALDRPAGRDEYLAARWLQRRLALANPLLDFDAILFGKRVPGVYNHMSDQYFGWWSRPGGGVYVLRDFQADAPPRVESLTDETFGQAGSFLRPSLSWDGRKILFAWCRHYPGLIQEQDKMNKDNVPEDAFYQLYEMDVDGSNVRRLTFGKYDDFDGRYLPDGRIVFTSTRRGHAVQVLPDTALQTMTIADQPDVYVRCGGGLQRPCVVYTLHTMAADGSDIRCISPFEMFEWNPSVAHDGTILYSRWDYIDRDNMPYMSLWAINPDGTTPRLVYGNYTHAPHCVFEPMAIPGSDKILFNATGHHSQTIGTLCLLDTRAGFEEQIPITRLTPEIQYPEIQGWPAAFYANPWPLSERVHLVTWGPEAYPNEGRSRTPNAMGLYLLDADGDMELLYRDPEITSASPMPLRPRPRPLQMAGALLDEASNEGQFLVADVHAGLRHTPRGTIKSLRVVAVPPKTHPVMNNPVLGLTIDDPGKCVLGTVPVEEDGSAYFRVPAGVTVFFQALDGDGVAVQTMRSATHVQPGQTLSCVGCHEPRHKAPGHRTLLAAGREPSRLQVGPEGSWPFRYDRLIQPVLDRHCVGCHRPDSDEPEAARFDLTAAQSYESLTRYGSPSLYDHVWARYRGGASIEGQGASAESALLKKLAGEEGHHGVTLSEGDMERLLTWMDTYAQRLGSFSDDQERLLVEMRRQSADLLIEREAE